MREYETVCILRSRTAETDVEEVVGRVGKLVQENKGEILWQRSLGKKALSYPIGKDKEGIFLCFDYAGSGPVVSEIERSLRYDERVLRFMTTLLQNEVDLKARKKELTELQAQE